MFPIDVTSDKKDQRIKVRRFRNSDVRSIIEILEESYASAYRIKYRLLGLSNAQAIRHTRFRLLMYALRLRLGKFISRLSKMFVEGSLNFLFTNAFDPTTLVAKCGNRIVGVVIIVRVNGTVWELTDVAVSSDFHNRKVGSLLMKESIKFIKHNNGTSLFLSVRADNVNAVKLYEKFGFSIYDKGYTMKLDLD